MMHRFLSLTLILVLVLIPVCSIASGQQQLTSSVAIARIKKTINKLSNRGIVTIKLRNGSKLKGRITQTAENMFTLKEANKHFTRDLYYADVLKVNTDGLSGGAKFSILTTIFTGAVVLGALLSLKHPNP